MKFLAPLGSGGLCFLTMKHLSMFVSASGSSIHSSSQNFSLVMNTLSGSSLGQISTLYPAPHLGQFFTGHWCWAPFQPRHIIQRFMSFYWIALFPIDPSSETDYRKTMRSSSAFCFKIISGYALISWF